MSEQDNQYLFKILKSAISDDFSVQQTTNTYTEEMLHESIEISKKHDLLHLLVCGLEKHGIKTDEQNLTKHLLTAVYRYEQINYTLAMICEALENAEISFIPLKGAVMRKYYPEPWMRTSCDIDILVHEEDADRAALYLVNNCGFIYQGKSQHDISMYSPNKNHLELHYDLLEDNYANKSPEILKSVWTTAITRDGKEYWHEMPDEMFYFYHIAHMAKHFEEGGCGIKPFIDLWILDKLNKDNHKKRDELLEQGELLTFANAVRKLSKIWLGNEEHDAVSLQIERYILHGGVYGTMDNRVSIQQQKNGGKFKYICSRIFMPYDELKYKYPIIQKHKIMTPIIQLRRWCNLLKPSALKRSLHEAKINSNISKNEMDNVQVFLNDIGL